MKYRNKCIIYVLMTHATISSPFWYKNDNGGSSRAVSSNTYHLNQGGHSCAFLNSTNYGDNMVGSEGPGDIVSITKLSSGSILDKPGKFHVVHVCVYLELMTSYRKAASSEKQSDQDTHPLPA